MVQVTEERAYPVKLSEIGSGHFFRHCGKVLIRQYYTAPIAAEPEPIPNFKGIVVGSGEVVGLSGNTMVEKLDACVFVKPV